MNYIVLYYEMDKPLTPMVYVPDEDSVCTSYNSSIK